MDNFVVRPKRRLVEKYSKVDAWAELKTDSFAELAHEIAGLPSEREAEDEEAKRFDLLILNLQLAVLRIEPAFKRLSALGHKFDDVFLRVRLRAHTRAAFRVLPYSRHSLAQMSEGSLENRHRQSYNNTSYYLLKLVLSEQVKAIAGLLEEKASILMVQQQLPLIQDLQTDEWWQDVTTSMLENVRKRIRALVKLIEKQQRKPIYTDFEDQIGSETAVELPGFITSDSFKRFRAKTRQFLREHEDDLVIHKLRLNEPLTSTDLQELERMLTASGLAKPEHLQKAKMESNRLGLFVRSLVGLDREAAKKALAGFMAGKTLGANQIEFVNLIIEHLTEHGVMDAGLLYESPFTDITPQGPDGLFPAAQIDQLVWLLGEVRQRAMA